MNSLRRYLALYAALWKNSVVREMGFKVNFLLWIVVDLLWFALQVTFIAVIYRHTEHIGDWSKWEVIMLVAASHFTQQIFTGLFLNNCVQLSEHIRTGRFDFFLLLPVNTRFLISFRQVDLGAFVNATADVVVMVYAARQLNLSPTVGQLAGFLGLCGVGVIIHYSLMFLLTSVAFWTVKAQGIVWGYYNLFNIARLPDAAFHGFFKAFFTFAIPMILVANVPARLIAGKLSSPPDMLLLLAMSVVCFALSEWVWQASMRRYTSASS